MSAYTKLISGLVFPMQEQAKRHDTVRVRREMESTQWWPQDRILDLQARRLRELLLEATKVPYWRDLFARIGFDPLKVRGPEDLVALPMLDKSTIRQNVEAMKLPGARGLARFNTGGSSGEPLVFFIGKERVSHDVAAKWRATRWWNVDIGDPEIVVWGSPIELGNQDRIRAVRDRVMRTQLLPAFDMSPARLDQFVQRLRDTRPRMLFGYPSALSHIARHAEKCGQRMNDLDIRVAFVTSERLYDEQRADIERIFGCPVANGYGGRDAGFIAHQCPHGGMHVTAEDIVVEILDRDGHPVPAGQPGEIVTTHLATREFPFIRYRTGDVGVMDSATCACGRGLPLLKEVQGRSTDFVVTESGTVMHGLALIYVLRDLPAVAGFRISQESLTLTRVQVVRGTGFDDETERHIRRGLQARLGAGVSIEIESVDEIPAERSGKHRYVVSKVAV